MGCGSAKISSVRHPSTPCSQSLLEQSPASSYKVIPSQSNQFSTTTAISGNARIRVTLSSDGSLLEIETERFSHEEEEVLNDRLCTECDKASTSTHTCCYNQLEDTFIYHRHLLDNSLSISQSRSIHSSLPDFRKFYTPNDRRTLLAMCTGNQLPRELQDNACQTWDVFPVEQLDTSPRPLRPSRKACTASQGYTCLEYCAKQCHNHTSIQRTDSSLIGASLKHQPILPAITNKKGSTSKRKGGIVKRSRTFDVPPDGGVIVNPAVVQPLPSVSTDNESYHVKRSSTFDGTSLEDKLPNGHVVRAHTFDDVKSTEDTLTGLSFLASLKGSSTSRSKGDSYASRLKRFSRQNSVQSSCLSRENSEQSQSTKSSLLSRQASAQSSPDSDLTLSIEARLKRRLWGWGSKSQSEVIPECKFSSSQDERKESVVKQSSTEVIDEGLGLMDSTVHQDFYNDFGDLFDDELFQ